MGLASQTQGELQSGLGPPLHYRELLSCRWTGWVWAMIGKELPRVGFSIGIDGKKTARMARPPPAGVAGLASYPCGPVIVCARRADSVRGFSLRDFPLAGRVAKTQRLPSKARRWSIQSTGFAHFSPTGPAAGVPG